MNFDLTEIRGIGPSTAEVFKSNGFKTVTDLAEANVFDIMAIPGFRQARAEQVISAAKMLAAGSDDAHPGATEKEADVAETETVAAETVSAETEQPQEKNKKAKAGKKKRSKKSKDKTKKNKKDKPVGKKKKEPKKVKSKKKKNKSGKAKKTKK